MLANELVEESLVRTPVARSERRRIGAGEPRAKRVERVARNRASSAVRGGASIAENAAGTMMEEHRLADVDRRMTDAAVIERRREA
jgi:hypothetical protein